MNDLPPNRIVIASNVIGRDGIGIEKYRNDELVIELFRDDNLKNQNRNPVQGKHFVSPARRVHRGI